MKIIIALSFIFIIGIAIKEAAFGLDVPDRSELRNEISEAVSELKRPWELSITKDLQQVILDNQSKMVLLEQENRSILNTILKTNNIVLRKGETCRLDTNTWVLHFNKEGLRK